MLTRLQVGPPGAAGDHSVLYLPREWAGDGTRLGVVLGAGTGTAWTAAYSPDVFLRIAEAVTDTGCAVITSEMGTDQFGNMNCQNRISALVDLLGTAGARTDKVALAGFSQGGGNVLAWAGNNPTRVHSVTGWAPLTDLALFDGEPRLEAVYAGGWDESTYGATCNPATMAAAGKYAGIPITLCYSSNDPVIPPVKVMEFGATASATLVDVGAVGHDWIIPNLPASIDTLLDLIDP